MSRPDGASWWKVDFHAHSPASFDYGAEEGHLSEETTDVDVWLQTYMDAEVDALVITDHNTGAGIEVARTMLERMRTERPESFRELVLFAGVELTVNDGYHLLAVFDVDTAGAKIDRLLARCNFRGTFGTSDATAELTFEQAVAEIIRDGGLAVPAHVETRGFLNLDIRSQSPIVDTGHILAAECTTPDGIAKIRSLGWVALLGSDAHHLNGNGIDPEIAKYPGSHFSWVKMATPNLNGLRVALSDGEDSVRPSSEFVDNPNDYHHSVIQRVVVSKSRQTFEQRFSPWMSAIIGGRGVGKSTVLEVVRLTMGRFDELPPRLKSDQSYFSPGTGQDSARFWNEDTTLEIYLSKLGHDYRVLWTGRDPVRSTIEVWSDNAWQTEPGSVVERFPILMYSQKQIYETAQHPQSLLRMIDQQPLVDYQTWKDRFELLGNQYRKRRAEIAGFNSIIESESRLQGELADIVAEIEQLAAVVDSTLTSELDILFEEEKAVSDAESVAADFEAAITGAVEKYEREIGESAPLAGWSPLEERAAAVAEALRQIRGAVDALRVSRESLQTNSVDAPSPRQLRIAEIQTQLIPDDAVDGADNESLDPAARREALTARQRQIVLALRDVGTARTFRVDEMRLAESLLTEIREHRAALTNARKAAIDAIKTPGLSLKVFQQADEDGLEADLRRLTNKTTAFDSVFAKESGLRASLSHPQSPNYLNGVEKLKSALKDLRLNGSDSTYMGWVGTIESRFFTGLAAIDSDLFETEVDLWFPEDRLDVKYGDAAGGPMRSLDEGSPGQKTAALLAVILQLSDDPLILDQPEDDLDNKLIYELVVKALKRSKIRRQVIVVTHNANVVVNADAELVIVMERGGPVPETKVSGSIQSEVVKAAICQIMEGGEQAFVSRYNRLVRA